MSHRDDAAAWSLVTLAWESNSPECRNECPFYREHDRDDVECLLLDNPKQRDRASHCAAFSRLDELEEQE